MGCAALTYHRCHVCRLTADAECQVHRVDLPPQVEVGKAGSIQLPDVGHPNPKSNGTAHPQE